MDLPYNVRELLDGGLPGMLGIASALVLVFGAPLAIVRIRSIPHRLLLPLLLSLAAAMLLRATLPLESIADVAGSRTTGFSPFLEDSVRLAALLLVPATLTALGAFPFAYWLGRTVRIDGSTVALALWLVAAWWVAVRNATTDNLVELLREGASLHALAALLGWLGTGLAQAMLLGGRLLCRRRIGVGEAIMWFAGFALAWWLANLASEPVIIKYGSLFSGLQFLLSPDRNHYLEGPDLLLRFLAFQVLFVFGLVMVQAPFVRWLCRSAVSG